MSSRKRAHGLPCPYCARPMDLSNPMLQPTRDHVLPQSRGGTAVIICCLQCNGHKADMLPDQWAAYMVANPRWWLMSRAERRVALRGPRQSIRAPQWGYRHRPRQGSPPAPPVIVPPELVWPEKEKAPVSRGHFPLRWDDRAADAPDTNQLPP